MYSIPCDGCSKVYIGQTGRSLKHRLAEHHRALKNGDVAASALAEHTSILTVFLQVLHHWIYTYILALLFCYTVMIYSMRGVHWWWCYKARTGVDYFWTYWISSSTMVQSCCAYNCTVRDVKDTREAEIKFIQFKMQVVAQCDEQIGLPPYTWQLFVAITL